MQAILCSTIGKLSPYIIVISSCVCQTVLESRVDFLHKDKVEETCFGCFAILSFCGHNVTSLMKMLLNTNKPTTMIQTKEFSERNKLLISDRTDLSTESGSGPIQLAQDRYRAARRSVADSPPHCMNAQKIVSYYTQSHTRRKESGETEHSVHGAEAESPSISMCHVAAHASGLGERDHRRHTWWASVFRPPWSICGVWTSV